MAICYSMLHNTSQSKLAYGTWWMFSMASSSSQLNGSLWLQFLGCKSCIRFDFTHSTYRHTFILCSLCLWACVCMHFVCQSAFLLDTMNAEDYHVCKMLCDGLKKKKNIQIILATPLNFNHFHWHPPPYATIQHSHNTHFLSLQ